MEDYKLRIFVTAARCLSLTATAAELGTTQPSVSKHIKELENSFGVELFDRSTTRIKLTDAGRVLLKESEMILARYEMLNNHVEAIKTQISGTLYIGATTLFSRLHLSMAISVFAKQNPLVRIDIVSGCSADIEQRLLDGEIGIGFVETPNYIDSLIYTKIGGDDIVLLGAKHFANNNIYSLPIINYGADNEMQNAVYQSLTRQHIAIDNMSLVHTVDSIDTAAEMAQNGNYTFFAPAVFCEKGGMLDNLLPPNIVIRNSYFSVKRGDGNVLVNRLANILNGR